MNILKEALWWATEANVPVFPCNSNKRPMNKHGHLEATTDPEKVKFFFENLDDTAYIGGRMGKDSGLFAMDFDLYKGEVPQNFMDDLLKQGLLPETRRHRTKSGGLHLIYKHDSAWPNMVPCNGVEVKGEGGYIILTPSNGYTVEREGLVSAPDGLIELLASIRKETSGITVDAYKMKIIQAEEFHDSIRQIVVKRALQSWPVEKIIAELRSCLEQSIAAADPHPRHDRWLSLFLDTDKELTRMVLGGTEKFSPAAATEGMREVSYENKESWGAAAKAVGFLAAPVEKTPEIKSPKEVNYSKDEWPFSEKDGYFASATHDLLDQTYVMHPFFAEDETTVLFAEPKMGKTAWNLTASFYIACGLDFGTSLKVTEPRACIYYALEGSRAIKLRIEALKRQLTEDGVKLPETIPLFIVERPTNFLKEETRLEACNQIIAANNYCISQSASGKGLGIISIDTLTKAMSSGDQNSVEDTSALFELSGLLRQAGVRASVVFVHHKARTGGVRGSTNIEAEPDVLLDVSKDGQDIVVKVARARSIEEGGKYVFGTKGYSLGTTAQGIDLSSFTVYAKDADTVTEASVGDALLGSKVLKVICAMGAGVHSLESIYAMLKSADLEPTAATKRKRGTPKMSAKYIQEFFMEHISATGRVFGDVPVTLNVQASMIVSILVAK